MKKLNEYYCDECSRELTVIYPIEGYSLCQSCYENLQKELNPIYWRIRKITYDLNEAEKEYYKILHSRIQRGQ